jgi:hypothetical protein
VLKSRRFLVVVSLSVGLLLSIAASAQTPGPSPNAPQSAPAQTNAQTLSEQQKEDFRTKMMRKPLPGSGCFEASYPNEEWNPVQCKPPPKPPSPLALVRRPTINVGNGNGYFATVTGNISSATGSFDSATGITAVYSPIYQDKSKTVYSDTYSLQLNSNKFSTSATAACAGGAANCHGWQQFLFSQRSACGTACVYIEYWLFDSPSCPSNGKLGKGCACPPSPWTAYYDPSGQTASGCYFNTPAPGFSTPAVADLGKLKFTGAANSGGTDVVTVQTADGNLHATSYPDSTLNLAQGWNGAEFNVFGDCCAYPVFFNTGSNLTVRLSTTSASAPICTQSFDGTTAETNNLSLLVGSCHPDVGGAQAIVFSESGGGDPSGYAVGDPHLATFYGVHYDFQASGDFLLAQADPNLIVQARHKSLNPSVSVNTAVATKMGDTRVAVCLPARLEINGTPEDLADGKAIAYGGVLVSRKGNVYEILGPGAAMVRAKIAPNLNYIDAFVFPGGSTGKLHAVF